MSRTKILWGALMGISLLAMSCTSTRYYTSSEYDDVYYTPDDQTNVDRPVVATNENQVNDNSSRQYDSAPVYSAPDRSGGSYNDSYYEDDDFTFSRRIRRFNNTGTGFRYFDPYYSNDLYYVIGTPSWSRWNQRGWHNWNYPRFGVSWGYNPGWNNVVYSGFYNPYSYNPWNNVNYYNPWVDSYYGYSPWYGSTGFGGFNNGWGRYGGYGGGFGGNAYCPPSYYRNGTFSGGGNNNNTSSNTYTRYQRAHRDNPASVASRSGTGSRNYDPRGRVKTRTPGTTGAPVTNNGTVRNAQGRTSTSADYLRPPVNRSPVATQSRTNTATQSGQRPTTTPRAEPRVFIAPDRNSQATPRTSTPSRTRPSPRATSPSRQVTPQRAPSRNNNTVRQQRTTPTRTPRVQPTRTPSRQPRVTPSRTPAPRRNVTPSRTPSPSPRRSVSPSRSSTPSSGRSVSPSRNPSRSSGSSSRSSSSSSRSSGGRSSGSTSKRRN